MTREAALRGATAGGVMTTCEDTCQDTLGSPARRKSRAAVYVILALLPILALEGAGFAYIRIDRSLPDVGAIHDLHPALVTDVFDRSGNLVYSFGPERRRLVLVSDLPDHVVRAFLAAEDSDFYLHRGVDLRGIGRAALANLLHFEVRQGGSTITQQLAKLCFLDNDRTFDRKVKEALLAIRMEKQLEKDEILSHYLNLIYLGSGAYGIEEGALTYFGVPARDLTLAQAATLAGVIQAPSRLTPLHNPEGAKKRRAWVLSRMAESGWIDREEERRAAAEPILPSGVGSLKPPPVAPYYLEEVKKELARILGEEELARGGYRVYTGLDLEMQREAEAALRSGLERQDRRIAGARVAARPATAEEKSLHLSGAPFFSGPWPQAGEEAEALVTGAGRGTLDLAMNGRAFTISLRSTPWKKGSAPAGSMVPVRILKVTGSRIEAELVHQPELEGALVSIDPQSREVRAMAGGYSFQKSQFNRATQARRQPGSAMKPIIYAAAFASRKWTPASVIDDRPLTLTDQNGKWRPKNYSQRYHGITTLYEALVHSRNVVTVRLALKTGLANIVELASLMGLAGLPADPSISLGAHGVSLLELVNAYAVFADRGDYRPPVIITRIVDRYGRAVYEPPAARVSALTPAEAYQMIWALEGVVKSGTAGKARSLGRRSAGKTGTTSDYRDAWYIGFSPELVTGVWVGRDDFTPIAHGVTGGKAALPIWIDYTRRALDNAPRSWFEKPEGVYFARVDPGTGLRAAEGPGISQCFLKGTRPRKAPDPEEEEECATEEGDSVESENDADKEGEEPAGEGDEESGQDEEKESEESIGEDEEAGGPEEDPAPPGPAETDALISKNQVQPDSPQNQTPSPAAKNNPGDSSLASASQGKEPMAERKLKTVAAFPPLARHPDH